MHTFPAQIVKLKDVLVVRIPQEISQQLPSRGLVMAQGKMNNCEFKQVLEPDGKRGHWMEIEEHTMKKAGLKVGQSFDMQLEPTKDWIEPKIPQDLNQALERNPLIEPLWSRLTPMARWEWIRWINSTGNPVTRQHRIDVGISKLNAGSRRPCCFNSSQCTVPSISKNGVLLETA